MAKQIQIRRGTADEHNNFTGAIGELTMDTTNKTLRIHDGETTGGTLIAKQSTLDTADYVVATQIPTASNGYTWYRKYKSGWVEQGGVLIGGFVTGGNAWSTRTIPLPIAMMDNAYRFTATGNFNWTDGHTTDDSWWFDDGCTPTAARLAYIGFLEQTTFSWRICGQSAA